jgi:hypothetical protein
VPKSDAGKRMTSEELERINLECDLMGLVNRYAWPQGEKIVKDLLEKYRVEPRHGRIPVVGGR